MAKLTKQDSEVAMDRRTKTERRGKDRRTQDQPVEQERRTGPRREKVARRRQIDPTTCERDYTGDEIEFMQAMDAYKRRSGRMFPTCSEILEVIREMGYVKQSGPPATSAAPVACAAEAPAGEGDAAMDEDFEEDLADDADELA